MFKTRGPGASEITLVHQIQEGKGAEQRRWLEQAANSDWELPLWGCEQIHFLRACTIDRDTQFLFCLNIDGAPQAFFADFLVHAPDLLDQVWGRCVGYPDDGARDFKGFMQFIVSGYVPCQLFFAAY